MICSTDVVLQKNRQMTELYHMLHDTSHHFEMTPPKHLIILCLKAELLENCFQKMFTLAVAPANLSRRSVSVVVAMMAKVTCFWFCFYSTFLPIGTQFGMWLAPGIEPSGLWTIRCTY